MDKRYQVFVSSTYEDLIEERLEVMKALLELDCIPCGMEYFPAANEDQWTFIKNLIDTCDYYIVIIGGKYGSEHPDGKSYTQMEYEYALSQGIPTMGFIHPDRNSLSPGKRETEKVKQLKLEEFIVLVRTKLCKNWINAYELGAVVSRSLTQLMKSSPMIGWVRGDRIGSEELLEEINNLRKEKEVLQQKIADLEEQLLSAMGIDNIAFDDAFSVYGTYRIQRGEASYNQDWKYETSWKNVFELISPYLLQWYNEEIVGTKIARSILKEMGITGFYSEQVDQDVLQSIKVQFLSLGLIQVNTLNTAGGTTGLFWELTQEGKMKMLRERSVKKY